MTSGAGFAAGASPAASGPGFAAGASGPAASGPGFAAGASSAASGPGFAAGASVFREKEKNSANKGLLLRSQGPPAEVKNSGL